jgi:hypothetical protein
MEPHENTPGADRPAEAIGKVLCVMTASDLSDLRERAENGDQEAVDELIELAGERGDWRWRYEIQWHPAPLGRDREPARRRVRSRPLQSRPRQDGGPGARDESRFHWAAMSDYGGCVAVSDLPASQHPLRSGQGLRTAN